MWSRKPTSLARRRRNDAEPPRVSASEGGPRLSPGWPTGGGGSNPRSALKSRSLWGGTELSTGGGGGGTASRAESAPVGTAVRSGGGGGGTELSTGGGGGGGGGGTELSTGGGGGGGG